jgi:hypothetical protein
MRLGALGELVAQPGAPRGGVDGLAVGLEAPPGEVAPEHPALGQLGGEAQRVAHGDGVEPQVVAEHAQLADVLQVEQPEVVAEQADGLELRALVRVAAQLDLAAAAHRARQAPVLLEQQLVAHPLAGELAVSWRGWRPPGSCGWG